VAEAEGDENSDRYPVSSVQYPVFSIQCSVFSVQSNSDDIGRWTSLQTRHAARALLPTPEQHSLPHQETNRQALRAPTGSVTCNAEL